MDSDTYRPTDCQVKRRDRLVYLAGQALSYSHEMALPVAAFHQVTRVAVDVTYGDATDADLRAAAEQCLADLDHMVDCVPLRTALRKAIDEIGAAASPANDGVDDGLCLDNALPAERADRRKDRRP